VNSFALGESLRDTGVAKRICCTPRGALHHSQVRTAIMPCHAKWSRSEGQPERDEHGGHARGEVSAAMQQRRRGVHDAGDGADRDPQLSTNSAAVRALNVASAGIGVS
jgi:hypothetical protein